MKRWLSILAVLGCIVALSGMVCILILYLKISVIASAFSKIISRRVYKFSAWEKCRKIAKKKSEKAEILC